MIFTLQKSTTRLLIILYLFWIGNCQEVNPGMSSSLPQATYFNVSYGEDPRHVLDLYLPAGRNNSISKVILIIHGGGWAMGMKEHMNNWAGLFLRDFPQHAVANMNYRLATAKSPAFPKQITDISSAISFLKSKAGEYSFQPKFALMGTSAGGHLSMLFGYGFDAGRDVEVICNHIGPSSLVDPNYTGNRTFDFLIQNVVGHNLTYEANKVIYEKASPVTYITKESPKTISFFGSTDLLIPYSQALILDDALDNAGVINKMYTYPGGHGNWNSDQYIHMWKKVQMFFKNYF